MYVTPAITVYLPNSLDKDKETMGVGEMSLKWVCRVFLNKGIFLPQPYTEKYFPFPFFSGDANTYIIA